MREVFQRRMDKLRERRTRPLDGTVQVSILALTCLIVFHLIWFNELQLLLVNSHAYKKHIANSSLWALNRHHCGGTVCRPLFDAMLTQAAAAAAAAATFDEYFQAG